MQQLSNNVLVLNVGDQLPEATDAVKIYLAGTQDLNPTNEHWQDKVCQAMVSLTEGPGAISVFKARKWIFINPLLAPQLNPMPSPDNPEFIQKMDWCYNMMGLADGIFMNFLKKSVSPVPLCEFGLAVNSGKLVIRCNPEYFQYGIISFFCNKCNVPLLPTSSNVKDSIWAFFSILPALQQNQKLQLPE